MPIGWGSPRRKWIIASAAGVSVVVLVSALTLYLHWSRLAVVPNVLGLTLSQSNTAIDDAGFRVGRVSYVESGRGADGAVIEQSPLAGTRLEAGATINVVLFREPEPAEATSTPVPVPAENKVTVPNLVGADLDSAGAALYGAGLVAGDVAWTTRSGAADGEVISQAPSAGAKVPKGTEVKLTVARAEQNGGAAAPSPTPVRPSTPAQPAPAAKPSAPVNQPPSADFTISAQYGTSIGPSGRLFTLSASSTSSDDGTIAVYSWTVTDGSTVKSYSGSAISDYWYNWKPTSVTLVVTDDKGLKDEATKKPTWVAGN